MLLKTQWFIEETKEEIKKHLKTNNKNIMIQNLWENKTMYREFPGPVVRTPCWGPKKKKKKKLWNSTKAVQREKFIEVQIYLRKQEKSQTT